MGRGERKKNVWSLEFTRSFQKSSNGFFCLISWGYQSAYFVRSFHSVQPTQQWLISTTNLFLYNCKIVLWFLHFIQCKKRPALQIFVLALYHDYQLTFACTYDWKNILLLRKTIFIQQLLPSSLSCVQMSILVKKSNPKYNSRTNIYSVNDDQIDTKCWMWTQFALKVIF